MTIVSAGRHRIDLHSSSVFVAPGLRAGYRDYLSMKHSFHASSCGRANECETLNANARIRMMSRSRNQKKWNLSLIPNQSQTLNQKRMH